MSWKRLDWWCHDLKLYYGRNVEKSQRLRNAKMEMASIQSSTELLGRRLLKEIAADEGSLEDVSPHNSMITLRLLSITMFSSLSQTA